MSDNSNMKSKLCICHSKLRRSTAAMAHPIERGKERGEGFSWVGATGLFEPSSAELLLKLCRTGLKESMELVGSRAPCWLSSSASPLHPPPTGVPGDDLAAAAWPGPRCHEGPLLLFSSQLPAPLPVCQDLRSALLSLGRCRRCPRHRRPARVVAVWVVALQTSALLPPDGAAPHRQHAAAEAQLALPEPGQQHRRCRRRTPGGRRPRRPQGLRSLGSRGGQPTPGAARRSGRWRGRGHQRGEPRRRRGRAHRL